jgi:membrane-associated protein
MTNPEWKSLSFSPMSFINVTSALNSNYSLAIIFAILALETALPLIIGLPGDTLLITAGFFAAGIGSSPIAAIAGSQFGHWLGWHYGIKIFNRPGSKFFDPGKIKSAEKYITKYGLGRAIMLTRFIPVVRHLINPLCGIIRIPFKTFAFWNILSAVIWTQLLIWGAYLAGNSFADTISKYLTGIIVIIVVITVIPLAWEIFKEWRSRKHLS